VGLYIHSSNTSSWRGVQLKKLKHYVCENMNISFFKKRMCTICCTVVCFGYYKKDTCTEYCKCQYYIGHLAIEMCGFIRDVFCTSFVSFSNFYWLLFCKRLMYALSRNTSSLLVIELIKLLLMKEKLQELH
jgi:hypothetical protein